MGGRVGGSTCRAVWGGAPYLPVERGQGCWALSGNRRTAATERKSRELRCST